MVEAPPADQARIEREGLMAALHARTALGDQYDREVIDSFLDRVERAIDARLESAIEARLDRNLDQRLDSQLALSRRDKSGIIFGLWSICVGVAVTWSAVLLADGVFGGFVLAGVQLGRVVFLLGWAGIATINVAYYFRRRRRRLGSR